MNTQPRVVVIEFVWTVAAVAVPAVVGREMAAMRMSFPVVVPASTCSTAVPNVTDVAVNVCDPMFVFAGAQVKPIITSGNDSSSRTLSVIEADAPAAVSDPDV